MIIEVVPTSLVHRVWPDVESFLIGALQYAGDDYTIEQVRANIARGEWLLVIASDENGVKGAAVVNIYNMPNYRVAFVVAIGGRLISSKESFEQFTGILKTFGADRVQGVGRDAIVRLWNRYGFQERYTLFEAKI